MNESEAKRYHRSKELFLAAIDQPADQRTAFLKKACADDPMMLSEIQALLEDHARIPDTLVQPEKSFPHPQPKQIGPFKIVKKIGEGGMGTVYEAEQDNPKRTVALKVIRAGLASTSLLKRFELESQVLGRLQHPGIGQIYQAGTADTESGKTPYFAMEYVRGVDLREYVKQNKLSTRDCLDLFARICDAVHHAHQKGVIHRDLKPGNILVDQSGQPKILDFGVARATDSDMQATTVQTDMGQLIGTLQYMSPEQVAADPNDLDTRSDVYALGVIAYEILTGNPPYNLKNKMIHEVARIIREDEPTLLSSSNRVFRGDIETIVVKALEKDKERRYQSAAGLANDVRRYLNDEPIHARPQSAIYQLQKFAKRNKALAGGMVIAITALVIGMSTSTYLYIQTDKARQGETQQRKLAENREADAVTARMAEEAQRKLAEQREADAVAARASEEEQRKLAEQREEEAVTARAETQTRADELNTVTVFQQSMLGEIDAETMGRGIVAAQRDDIRGQMESAGAEAADIETALASFDELVAKTNATNLALTVVDEYVLARAVTTINEEFAEQPLVQASLEQSVADTYGSIGLYQSAMPLQHKVLKTRRRILGNDHPSTLLSIGNMGNLLFQMGKHEKAEPYLREALEGKRRTLGIDHPGTLNAITNMAALLQAAGKFNEAMTYLSEAITSSRRALGDDHASTLTSVNNMALLLTSMGKLKEAELYYREALEGERRVHGDDHPHTLTSLGNMGFLLKSMGKLKEAEKYYREALDSKRRVLGDDHPSTLRSINNMGILLQSMGKFNEAMPYMREALVSRRHVLGDDHPETLTSISNISILLRKQRKYAEAEEYCREALDSKRRVLGDDHPNTLTSLGNMGSLLESMGKLKEAEKYSRVALDGQRRVLGDDHPDTLTSINNMGFLLQSMGKLNEALPYMREAIDSQRRVLGDDHPDTLRSINNTGSLLKAMGKLDEALPYLSQVVEGARSVLGDNHPNTLASISNLGGLLKAMGRFEDAEPYCREAMEGARSILGDEHPKTLLCINNLASLLKSMDKHANAEKYYREALEIKRRSLPEGHGSIASTLIQIGKMLIAQEKFKEAESTLRECVAIRDKALPAGHWFLPNTASMLGEAISGQGKFSDAEPLLLDAFETLQDREDAIPPAYREVRLREAADRIIKLYDAWHDAEPDKGYDTKAVEWKANLDAAAP